MNSRKALLYAVLAIFAAAFVAELTGVVQRDAPAVSTVSAEATGDAHTDAHVAAAGEMDAKTERTLRIGVMGAIACVGLYAVLRYRGVV